jgi:hypothetical protein
MRSVFALLVTVVFVACSVESSQLQPIDRFTTQELGELLPGNGFEVANPPHDGTMFYDFGCSGEFVVATARAGAIRSHYTIANDSFCVGSLNGRVEPTTCSFVSRDADGVYRLNALPPAYGGESGQFTRPRGRC